MYKRAEHFHSLLLPQETKLPHYEARVSTFLYFLYISIRLGKDITSNVLSCNNKINANNKLIQSH